MIIDFANADTQAFWSGRRVKRLEAIADACRRKLDILHAAQELIDLLIPPGNRLEALSGNRKGQHSIRINGQYRICFIWDDKRKGATHVEIVDYH